MNSGQKRTAGAVAVAGTALLLGFSLIFPGTTDESPWTPIWVLVFMEFIYYSIFVFPVAALVAWLLRNRVPRVYLFTGLYLIEVVVWCVATEVMFSALPFRL